jgi:hypothetical protein
MASGFLLFSCLPPPATPVNQALRTIHVYKVYNETAEESIPSLLREKIVDTISRDGRLIPVPEMERADGLLVVNVRKYFRDTVTWNDQMMPDRVHLGIEVKMVLQDQASKRVLRSTLVEDSTNFNQFTEPARTEAEARLDLLQDLAERIVTITIEGFD